MNLAIFNKGITEIALLVGGFKALSSFSVVHSSSLRLTGFRVLPNGFIRRPFSTLHVEDPEK